MERFLLANKLESETENKIRITEQKETLAS